ncbi:hypothetical protein BaRGS_00002261, partial [Batillaria attramentaria]
MQPTWAANLEDKYLAHESRATSFMPPLRTWPTGQPQFLLWREYITQGFISIKAGGEKALDFDVGTRVLTFKSPCRLRTFGSSSGPRGVRKRVGTLWNERSGACHKIAAIVGVIVRGYLVHNCDSLHLLCLPAAQAGDFIVLPPDSSVLWGERNQ